MPLKIAIVVHGRFHAFDLARGLCELGHEVKLFTNYAPWRVRKYVPGSCGLETCWHSLARVQLWHRSRLARQWIGFPEGEVALLREFGTWAKKRLQRENWDVIYTWSSVSHEILSSASIACSVKLLARGSTHIEIQDRILREEQERTGSVIERPNPMTLARELQEYKLADAIVTLSEFCRCSFVEAGVSENRIIKMVAGVDVSRFKASRQDHEQRKTRIRRGGTLRLLMCGAFSFRKGAFDITELAKQLGDRQIQMRFVGSIASECQTLADSISDKIDFLPRVPQSELKRQFDWGDVFLFPSLEEGLPQTLFQAAAAGLPVIATHNSAVADVLNHGGTGWAVAARDTRKICEIVEGILADRELLISRLPDPKIRLRTWRDSASDLCREIESLRAPTVTKL